MNESSDTLTDIGRSYCEIRQHFVCTTLIPRIITLLNNYGIVTSWQPHERRWPRLLIPVKVKLQAQHQDSRWTVFVAIPNQQLQLKLKLQSTNRSTGWCDNPTQILVEMQMVYGKCTPAQLQASKVSTPDTIHHDPLPTQA